MAFVPDEDLTLLALSAEPGTAPKDGLRLLAAWAATHDRQRAVPTADET